MGFMPLIRQNISRPEVRSVFICVDLWLRILRSKLIFPRQILERKKGERAILL